MVCVSGEPDTRSARTNALRWSALARQLASSCTHDPLPPSAFRSSMTRRLSWMVTLRSEEREPCDRQPTHVRTGSILHLPRVYSRPASGAAEHETRMRGLVLVENRVWLDVDLGTGELGGQTRVLTFLTDSEGKLVVRNQGANGLGLRVQNERAGDLCR